ncbi:type II toxin-antitoxin system VapC family toxin [Desulfococcaceae bacterium HSG8]|nr:type II toxin-antitoxin system VapC family toxin [Desulfococcaceae bacterium HSG8]
MGDQRHYFDANALFKYYQDQKGSLNIRRLVSRSPKPVMVSSLTLLECFGVVVKYQRKRLLKQKDVNKVFKRIRRDAGKNTKIRPFEIIPMPDGVFRLAQSILLQHARIFQIGSNDALHLAIVKKSEPKASSTVMVTSDNSMKNVCDRIQTPVYDPEL